MNGLPGKDDKRQAASANPFLQSAQVFAAATAVGIGFQRHFASAMLGFFETALSAGRPDAKAPETPAQAAPVVAEPAVVTREPVTVGEIPVVKPPVSKAPAAESKPKVVVAKVAVVKPAVSKAPAQPLPAVTVPVRKVRVARDDLKQIPGIGPKLEEMLNGKGIKRLADIAAWSDADAKRIDGELALDGRIGRDDWVGQAKALAGGRKAKT